MIPEWNFAGRQILGCREAQEDAYAFMGLGSSKASEFDPLFFVLADGMGGYTAGDVASGLATEEFCKQASISKKDWRRLFEEGLAAANEKIEALNKNVGESGCTVVSSIVHGGKLFWVSVGDSALYLFRGGELIRLNQDHSLRSECMQRLEKGEISAEEAQHNSSLLCSAITGDEIEQVDLNVDGRNLHAGDIIIAATDGLETINHNEIERKLGRIRHLSASSIASALLNSVENERKDQQDNTTILCIKL